MTHASVRGEYMRLNNLLLVVFLLSLPMTAFSGTLQDLAIKFGKDVKRADVKIAVMDFSASESNGGQDSFVIRERLTTFLAQNKNVVLVERALLEKVFQEQKIQFSGGVSADTAKRIGELTGAAAIVSGTFSELDNEKIEVNARIIEVETGKVISAGQAVFKKDWKYLKPPALDKDEKVAAGSAQDYYRRATQYFNDRKYNMALEFYSKAIKLKQDYLEAYYGRGSVYALMAKYDEAIIDFSRVIELKVDFTDAYFSRAMAYRNRFPVLDGVAVPKIADYTKAISDLDKAIELTPTNTATTVDCRSTFVFIPDAPDYIGNYLQRGSVYATRGSGFNPDNFTPSALQRGSPDLWAAIEDYNKGIKQFPNCAEMYAIRGAVYQTIPDYTKAISDYSKAIELSTNSTSNYVARGSVHYAKGDYDLAIADYTTAITLRAKQNTALAANETIPRWEDTKPVIPDFGARFAQDDSIYIDRGNAYYMKKDYRKAIADYTKTIELSPSYSAHTNRANAYRVNGEIELAISDYSKAIELNPTSSIAYQNRADAYRDGHDSEKALRDYSKASELDPKNADAAKSQAEEFKRKRKELGEKARSMVVCGMLREKVLEILGEPEFKDKDDVFCHYDAWVYGRTWIFFSESAGNRVKHVGFSESPDGGCDAYRNTGGCQQPI